MTDAKDNSSLPLLLSITGAILAVAAGGWYLLNKESAVADSNQIATISAPRPATAVTSIDMPLETAGGATEDLPESSVPAVVITDSSPAVDAELRKARLAADADILVLPASQSALYYYGRVLEADPRHAIAAAELDSILARVEQTVTQHLGNDEFDDAYEIAQLVAAHRPEHDLVVETQTTLDQMAEQLVEQAIQLAQDGDDEQASELIANVENLPGRNANYIGAVRDSIDEIRNVRLAAEADRTRRAQLAENDAKAAWVDLIRAAIEQGNLIEPADASAKDLLAESNAWTTERNQLRGELNAALLVAAQSSIDSQQLGDAEELLAAAAEAGDETPELENVRASLEGAFIAEESNRIASMQELVNVKAVPPRYPRRAQERDQTGWVDVYFTVTPDGETADIVVNESDPEAVFDRAAVDAVEQWAFQPVEYRGRVISQRAAARIVFRLE